MNPKNEATQLATAIGELLDGGELKHFRIKIRPLLAVADEVKTEKTCNNVLPIHRLDYLRLVDVTGRAVAKGKRGFIDPQLAPILERIGLSTDEWLIASTSFKTHYRGGHIKVKATA